MANFRIHKVVAALPSTLTPNTVYAVRVGVGFDLYITDTTGAVAHRVNGSSGGGGGVHTGNTAPTDPAATPIWITLAGRQYFWDGTDWFEVPGRPGADGREVELQTTATHIQWRYAGATTWTNLLDLSTLGGGGSSFGQLRKASFLL